MIAAVVLAAGLARRMGRRKLLLDLGEKPVVRWAVEGVRDVVDETVVVTGPGDAAIREALAGLSVRFAVNPEPEAGQGASLAAGIAALGGDVDAALVVLGDQPWLPPGVPAALVAAARSSGRPIVVPLYRGTQGTPVLFAASVFPELLALRGDTGAKAIVQRDPARVARVEVDAPMPDDVDTPEDYARAAARHVRRVQ